MRLTRKELKEYLYNYTEDEQFYKKLYLTEKENPDSFQGYLDSLDIDYIKKHELYVPAITGDGWYPYIEEKKQFSNISGNICLSKHYRYTPVFEHSHEFFEILCIYDGTASTVIQGISHPLQTGDICIIPPNTKHSVGIFDDSIAINIMIRSSTFQTTFFQSLTNNNALSQFFAHVLYHKTEGNFLIFHSGQDTRIRQTLEDLYMEYLCHEKYSYTFLNSMLILFWAKLLRYHETDIESILTKDTIGGSITEILNYLNKNYQNVSLSETAKHFGYSISHFSTLIKEGTGQTFLQIIRDIKLSQACRALKETSLSNHAICELVGYESPEHFMRLFKKTYGMTPGDYRKKYQNK